MLLDMLGQGLPYAHSKNSNARPREGVARCYNLAWTRVVQGVNLNPNFRLSLNFDAVSPSARPRYCAERNSSYSDGAHFSPCSRWSIKDARLDSSSSFSFRKVRSAQSRIVPSIPRNSLGQRAQTVAIRRIRTLADFRSGAELQDYPGCARCSGPPIRTRNPACIDATLLIVAYRALRVYLDALIRVRLIGYPTRLRCVGQNGHPRTPEPK